MLLGRFLLVCIRFHEKQRVFIAIDLLEKKRRLVALFVEQIFACVHDLLQTIFVHTLIVSSKCDAVGSFPACMYPFS